MYPTQTTTPHQCSTIAQAKPRCRPDAVSYGYLITCFAESKKPRSALTVFHQMRKRGIAPNGYTYMGVLKALSHMRDGISAVQVGAPPICTLTHSLTHSISPTLFDCCNLC